MYFQKKLYHNIILGFCFSYGKTYLRPTQHTIKSFKILFKSSKRKVELIEMKSAVKNILIKIRNCLVRALAVIIWSLAVCKILHIMTISSNLAFRIQSCVYLAIVD